MKLRDIRLLFLPNGPQPGPSACFRHLLATHQIAAYAEYDFLAKSATDLRFELRSEGILDLARKIEPNVILWEHVGLAPISAVFLNALRAVAPRAMLVYQELDAWGGRAKPLTRATKLLCGAAEALVLCGGHPQEELFRPYLRKEAKIHWFGHTADDRWLALGEAPGPEVPRAYDVVMIGNNTLPRRRWLRHVPSLCFAGSVNRYTAVVAVSRAFGDRAALYGYGWDALPGNRGNLPVEQQVAAQRAGWVSAMWNHYDTMSFYYSDRPVIAMMSGVPHVTNYQPGYELVFGPNGQHLFWASTPNVFVDTIRFLLSRPREDILEVGRRARAYARARLRSEAAFEIMLRNLVGDP